MKTNNYHKPTTAMLHGHLIVLVATSNINFTSIDGVVARLLRSPRGARTVVMLECFRGRRASGAPASMVFGLVHVGVLVTHCQALIWAFRAVFMGT